VSGKKNVLIVTDGTEAIDSTAQSIKKTLKDFKVKICPAAEFAGTDLLPAGIFFLGCEKDRRDSFSHLAEILAHINLASRKCGVFSTNEETLKYLKNLVTDCEAVLGDPLLVTETNALNLKKWLKRIIKNRRQYGFF
jgi:enolase